MAGKVEVSIDSIRVSLTNQQRLVILKDNQAETYLTIWIGPYEAESITIALQEIEIARPQTHDLLRNTIQALNSQLLRVEIISLTEDVFHGNLILKSMQGECTVDARPSDALALAIRCHVPILVAQEVMDVAGFSPADDIQESVANTDLEKLEEPVDPSTPRRLSVFEDFLENLDLDDSQKPPDPDQDPSGPPPPEPDL
jgi:bifunctional DNase/RNase